MSGAGWAIPETLRSGNSYLSAGQGRLGWTMACGSVRAVADVVLGRKPEIDFEGLTAERYGGGVESLMLYPQTNEG